MGLAAGYRAILTALTCLLSAGGVSADQWNVSARTGWDLAFWEEVIDAPTCEADRFVAYLDDPRGSAQCTGPLSRCGESQGSMVNRLCGAGMDVVEQSNCFRENPGRESRETALQCLQRFITRRTNWSVSRMIWLGDHGDRLPRTTRFRLSSEPEVRVLPHALRAIQPLPPRVVGLSEDDLSDENRAEEFWQLAMEVRRARTEAVLTRFEEVRREARSQAVGPLRSSKKPGFFERHDRKWNRETGREWLRCQAAMEGSMRFDRSRREIWNYSEPCSVDGLAMSYSLLLRSLAAGRIPR